MSYVHPQMEYLPIGKTSIENNIINILLLYWNNYQWK